MAGRKYMLLAAVVMPDHVHLLLQPMEAPGGGDYSLSSIVHSLRSYTAHEMGRRVWQRGFHDKIASPQAIPGMINYIADNPKRSGLVSDNEEYRWLIVA